MLEFEGIWKTYARELGSPAFPALKGVSFSLATGETLGLVGANGAGKSTCIRLIMDFIRPDEGSVTINGQSCRSPQVRKRIGYLPEIASLPANLTVVDMMRFAGSTLGLKSEAIGEACEHWLQLLDLWEARKRPLRTFSKGMQQRASFAVALIGDPDLLILDEPMSGLDPLGREKIINIISELKAQGKTILFCSHILEDVDKLADRILVLHLGEKKFEGDHKDFCLTNSSENLVEAFLKLAKGEPDA